MLVVGAGSIAMTTAPDALGSFSQKEEEVPKSTSKQVRSLLRRDLIVIVNEAFCDHPVRRRAYACSGE